MRSIRRSWVLLVPALFLVGYGMATYGGGRSDNVRSIAAAPTEVAQEPGTTVEASAAVVSGDCFVETPSQTETAAALPGQSTVANDHAKTASSGDDGSSASVPADEGSENADPTLPEGHPSISTDSECPRPRADSHP